MEYIGKMEVWTPKQRAFLMEHDFEGFPIYVEVAMEDGSMIHSFMMILFNMGCQPCPVIEEIVITNVDDCYLDITRICTIY